ncbi:hypothetical protein [Slackia equolifaciens]|uniref:hypothetical protein n=1 Tax=Slackia equolifaciens TaxID=498718 RepID=UPI0011CE5C55|nr:hypothetical protein [Slackia equolifaciens]
MSIKIQTYVLKTSIESRHGPMCPWGRSHKRSGASWRPLWTHVPAGSTGERFDAVDEASWTHAPTESTSCALMA